VNLWYAKTALDQAMLNQMQEQLSPGYLDRMKARAEREWGATWWWAPQDTGILEGGMEGPERAPNFANALGEH
jgi:hypothetical protein